LFNQRLFLSLFLLSFVLSGKAVKGRVHSACLYGGIITSFVVLFLK
jgi:hypothetical protein